MAQLLSAQVQLKQPFPRLYFQPKTHLYWLSEPYLLRALVQPQFDYPLLPFHLFFLGFIPLNSTTQRIQLILFAHRILSNSRDR